MCSIKKMRSSSMAIRYISSHDNEIENILIERKVDISNSDGDLSQSNLSDSITNNCRSQTPPQSRWSLLHGIRQRLKKQKSDVTKGTICTNNNIANNNNNNNNQESENESKIADEVAEKKSDVDSLNLDHSEIEHAIDCLEEMPVSDAQSDEQDDDLCGAKTKPFIQCVRESLTLFYSKNAKILKQILVGLILSLAAYWSLQFVFGFLFGLLFLLVIGCGNDTRTKFLKKAEKVLHSYTPLVQSSNEQIRVHQSWFRLYPEYEYDPSTYHVSRTLSVHLELRDNFLMISYTPYRMSTKMMISHTAKKLQNSKFFCHFRQIDLKLYHIYLLPNALKSDRVWSKKYPICLKKKSEYLVDKTDTNESATAAETNIEEITNNTQEIEEDDLGIGYDDCKLVLDTLQIDEIDGNNKKPIKCHHSTYHKTNSDLFFIFAKTNREKESWYRKLLHASCNDETSKNQKIKFESFMGQIVKCDKGIDDFLNLDLMWINSLVGRIFYHFVNDSKWIELFEQLIQKKLDALKVATFIDDVTISKLNFGQSVPYVTKTHRPVIDDEGLWIDLGINYDGFIGFLLMTKINFMKANRKDDNGVTTESEHESEADDSVQSSSDEEFPDFPITSNPSINSPTKSRRFIDFMDKVATSKYFQNAKEYKYVKKAIEGVSKTELKLEISLLKLEGVLVLHIPNPIANRIWYGFRENPQLVLAAKPAVGERSININQITNWIENKLCQEFEKFFVLPNMEDLEVLFLDLDKFPNMAPF